MDAHKRTDMLDKHHTLGKTVHCDRVLAVSNPWEAAAASDPETPAARLTAIGDTGPTSLLFLNNFYGKKTWKNRAALL